MSGGFEAPEGMVWVAGPIAWLNRTTADQRSIERLEIERRPMPLLATSKGDPLGSHNPMTMVGEIRQVVLMQDGCFWARAWMGEGHLPDDGRVAVGIDVGDTSLRMEVNGCQLTDSQLEWVFDGYPLRGLVHVLSGRLMAVTAYCAGGTPAFEGAHLQRVDFEDSTPWITRGEDKEKIVSSWMIGSEWLRPVPLAAENP